MRARTALALNARARAALVQGMLATVLMLGGCATVQVGTLDPALFPAAETAALPPLHGQVALVLPPAVREQTHPGLHPPASGKPRIQLPLGDALDAALQRQLGAAFTGGALPAALPLAAGSGAAVALVVAEVRLVMDSKLNWMVPVPVPFPPFLASAASSWSYTARLELDLRLTDVLGRLLAQTTVDSGNVVFERGQWTTETELQLNQKLLHQAAWQAAAQAARVVRETVLADRQRERAL